MRNRSRLGSVATLAASLVLTSACGSDAEEFFDDQGSGGDKSGSGAGDPGGPGVGGAGGGASSGSGAGSASGSSSGTGAGGGAGGGGASSPIIDLRADVNRNGTIDLDDPTEDLDEDTWSSARGAIFLANLDDDQSACPTQNQTDAQLAACHDAADDVINGQDDLEDLARMKTVPWPGAPDDASATLTLSQPGATFVRLFKKTGSTFSHFDVKTQSLSAQELRAGVELAIEGKDFVRDAAVWDGFVDVTLEVNAGTDGGEKLPDGSDKVRLRVSPVMFHHHLTAPQRTYASQINSSSSLAFRNDLSAANDAAKVPEPLHLIAVSDQWTQDWFETAYMAMPKVSGNHVIHVNFRSANFGSSGVLRSAGRVVYTQLRGKNVAGAVQYDPAHANSMDTLNSFGNLETIPPYSHAGKSYPLGRVVRGNVPTFHPDKSFDKMVESQKVQPPVYVDTKWLLVGHIDETVSFIKASSPRGWAMLVNEPALAKQMLETQQANGYGGTQMFVGKSWSGGASAAASISQVLANADVMNESAWATVQIDAQLVTLKAATGLTDAELVPVPFLHRKSSGYSVAYQPGTVNGIYLSNTDFGPPDPHGPVINGADIFKTQLTNVLQPYNVKVHFIENWDLYHRLSGEVHCGSNATRIVPSSTKWWESGL